MHAMIGPRPIRTGVSALGLRSPALRPREEPLCRRCRPAALHPLAARAHDRENGGVLCVRLTRQSRSVRVRAGGSTARFCRARGAHDCHLQRQLFQSGRFVGHACRTVCARTLAQTQIAREVARKSPPLGTLSWEIASVRCCPGDVPPCPFIPQTSTSRAQSGISG